MKKKMHKHEKMIRDFLNSDKKYIEIDWKFYNYANVMSARSYMAKMIVNLGLDCYVTLNDGRLYLCKFDFDGELGKTPRTNAVKKLLEFVESDEKVMLFPWEEFSYADESCCYYSMKTNIKNYNLVGKIVVCRNLGNVYIFKIPNSN